MLDRKTMKETIETSLKVLVGMPLWNIERTATLISFDFGTKLTPFQKRSGETKFVGEYAIDTESAWHLGGPSGIIVASGDMAYPAGEDPHKDLLEFEWDKEGAMNRCDERIAMFLKENNDSPMIVEKVEADHLGGITIYLSAGHVLEIFPEHSFEFEYWRMFAPANEDKHFVVTSHGIK